MFHLYENISLAGFLVLAKDGGKVDDCFEVLLTWLLKTQNFLFEK